MDRRTLLRRAALVGAVGLAGCAGGDGSGDGTGTPEDTTDATTPSTDGGATGTTGTTDAGTETGGDPTEMTGAGTESGDEPTGTADAGTEAADATATDDATTATPSEPRQSVTVVVGADGSARFSPDSFTLAQGGGVTFEWAMAGHNVIVDSQPDGASFEGTDGGASETYGEGYSYSQTLETPGEYAYYCSVHEGFGMTGTFTVE